MDVQSKHRLWNKGSSLVWLSHQHSSFRLLIFLLGKHSAGRKAGSHVLDFPIELAMAGTIDVT